MFVAKFPVISLSQSNCHSLSPLGCETQPLACKVAQGPGLPDRAISPGSVSCSRCSDCISWYKGLVKFYCWFLMKWGCWIRGPVVPEADAVLLASRDEKLSSSLRHQTPGACPLPKTWPMILRFWLSLESLSPCLSAPSWDRGIAHFSTCAQEGWLGPWVWQEFSAPRISLFPSHKLVSSSAAQSDVLLDNLPSTPCSRCRSARVPPLLSGCCEAPAASPPPFPLSVSLPPAQGPRQVAGRGQVLAGTLPE